MMAATGHSILAHSRSSTSEVFDLPIIKFTYCMNIGQIKPLNYCVHSALEKFMNKLVQDKKR